MDVYLINLFMYLQVVLRIEPNVSHMLVKHWITITAPTWTDLLSIIWAPIPSPVPFLIWISILPCGHCRFEDQESVTSCPGANTGQVPTGLQELKVRLSESWWMQRRVGIIIFISVFRIIAKVKS